MMPSWLTWRALRHYRVSHAAVALAAALTSSILIGGLLLGSSMKASLARIARRNLGEIRQTAQTGQRLVNADLAGPDGAALLLLSGQATNANTNIVAPVPPPIAPPQTAPTATVSPATAPANSRAEAILPAASNHVQVCGVDERFWKLYPTRPREIPDGQVILNAALAEQLRVKAGDDILLKVPLPSALPKDLVLALEERQQLSFRLKVAEVVGADDFGDFNRSLTQLPPHNALVSRDWLSRQLGQPSQAGAAAQPNRANFFAWASDVRSPLTGAEPNNRAPAHLSHEPSSQADPAAHLRPGGPTELLAQGVSPGENLSSVAAPSGHFDAPGSEDSTSQTAADFGGPKGRNDCSRGRKPPVMDEGSLSPDGATPASSKKLYRPVGALNRGGSDTEGSALAAFGGLRSTPGYNLSALRACLAYAEEPRASAGRQELVGLGANAGVGSNTGAARPLLSQDRQVLPGVSLADLGLTLATVPGLAQRTIPGLVQATTASGPAEATSRPASSAYQLSTDAVFFSPATEDAMLALPLPGDPPRQPILTYFVNEIRHGQKSTPYSFITGSVPPAAPSYAPSTNLQNPLPMPPADDQIILTDWLAEDIGAKVGDEIQITYFVLGPSRKLEERSSQFTVAGIVPLAQHADSALMPSFPGISDAVSCRDWKSGLPIDTNRIRPKDEQYWNEHRSTPKAYVTLAQAEKMWATVYGSTTAIRYYPGVAAIVSAQRFNKDLLARLNPSDFGFLFTSYAASATAGTSKASEFSGLFLGLSLFLILSALLLAGLVISFSLRSRAAQLGLLGALGWTKRLIGRAIMREFTVPILAGSLLGLAGGAVYGLLLVWGLKTIWRGAVHTSEIVFAVEPLWLVIGPAVTCVLGWVVCRLVVAALLRKSPRALLAGEEEMPRPRRSKWPVIVLAALAISGLISLQSFGGNAGSPLVRFGFGVGILAMFLLLELLRLTGSLRSRREHAHSLVPLSAARRPGRSFAVIAMMACGCFLIFTLAGNRRVELSPEKLAEGTGGFEYMVTLAMPLLTDPTTQAGRSAMGSPAAGRALLARGRDARDTGENVLPLRVLSGDDASCLNLGKVLRPQVLGVRPELLARTRFVLKHSLDPSAGWDILSRPIGGAVPAIVDETTLEWGLQGKLGMELIYQDEGGRRFPIRIAAVMADGVLQGNLLIDEAQFIQHFPSQAGYRMLLSNEAPGTAGGLADGIKNPPAMQEASTATSAGAEGTWPLEAAASKRGMDVSSMRPTGVSPVEAAPGQGRDVPATHGQDAHATAESTLAALERYGPEIVPTHARLAELNEVENTYLAIFALLGGLALVLGSAGVGIVLLRNVLERIGELALLQAVGFTQGSLTRMIVREHFRLLEMGLVYGLFAAVIALGPAHVFSREFPWDTVALAGGGILVVGLLCVYLAGRWALHRPILPALRNE